MSNLIEHDDDDAGVADAVAYDIAVAFDRLLRCAIAPADYDRVIELNRAEPNPHVCHSHDFCDANEVMAEAFEDWTGSEPRPDSDEDTSLWNNAWDTWKLHAPFRDERAPC